MSDNDLDEEEPELDEESLDEPDEALEDDDLEDDDVDVAVDGDELEIDLRSLDIVARWIAGYGPEVVVLHPPELSTAVRQAWAAAISNDFIVVYDAIGVNASSNITFTLPALPAGELWDTWRYDPETGNYAFQSTLSNKAGGTSLTIPRGTEFAHDTVFLLKAQP